MDNGKVVINAKRKVSGEWVDIDIDEIDWENIHEVHVKGKYHYFRNQWIPVTERLPEDDVEVIVSCTDDSGYISFSFTTVAWHFNGTWICNNERCFFITAWMPLPEPWKGEQDA